MSLPASPPEIVALMRLLTDPTRWRIYGVLRQRAASVGELADARLAALRLAFLRLFDPTSLNS